MKIETTPSVVSTWYQSSGPLLNELGGAVNSLPAARLPLTGRHKKAKRQV